MKKIILLFSLLLTSFTYAQTTIKFQDFESGADDWNYTVTPAAYNTSGDVWDIVTSVGSISAAQNGSNFWGMRDLANTNGGVPAGDPSTIAFDNVDISGQSNVVVSFYYNTVGYDMSDSIKVEFFYDDVSQGEEELLKDTNAWTLYSKAIPAGTNNVRLNIIAIQNGGSDYAGVDNFKVESGAVAAPSLAITSPSNGYVFSPETTDVTVEFTVQNFNVANGTGDGHIHWRLDSGSVNMQYDTNPVQLTGLTSGSHTVDMELVDNSHNSLSPPVTASVTFEIATYTQVADLTELRAANTGEYYEITGEIFLIKGYLSGTTVKAYLQDADAGIMVYDNQGVITSTYNPGDGFINVKGKLVTYGGMLEIKPTIDPGVPNSTGNTLTVTTVPLADYIANHDDYESRLIKIEGVIIDPDGDTAFQHNHNYNFTDGTDTASLRTVFDELTGETIPTGTVDITGIGAQYNSNIQIYPRDINDIQNSQSILQNQIDGFKVYPNPVTNDQVFVSSNNNVDKQVFIYDFLGKLVISTKVDNNQAIQVNQLKEGVYLMKVVENNRISVQQLIIK